MALYELDEKEITFEPSHVRKDNITSNVALSRVLKAIKNSASLESEATAKTKEPSQAKRGCVCLAHIAYSHVLHSCVE